MIYILKFSHPIGNPAKPKGQAGYYIGWCPDDGLEDRLSEHSRGQGAAITRAVVERGFRLELVSTLPGTRDDERKLKRQKNTPRIVRKLMNEVVQWQP